MSRRRDTRREIVLFPREATKEERLEAFEGLKAKHKELQWVNPNPVALGSTDGGIYSRVAVSIRDNNPFWVGCASDYPVGAIITQNGDPEIIVTHMNDWIQVYTQEIEL